MTPDLTRFLFAQEDVYETALAELRRGRKETHWMWFVFPQLAGLGGSAMARRYAIRDFEEARAYLAHPVLGARLRECCEVLLALEGRGVSEIFGDPDDLKLRSSMTLCALASAGEEEGESSVFEAVLGKYFGGGRDGLTLDLLGIARDGDEG